MQIETTSGLFYLGSILHALKLHSYMLLSYQCYRIWEFLSNQTRRLPCLQIKELYQKLTSLGYPCWLDIEQMGVGDALYEKIDSGVTAIANCFPSRLLLEKLTCLRYQRYQFWLHIWLVLTSWPLFCLQNISGNSLSMLYLHFQDYWNIMQQLQKQAPAMCVNLWSFFFGLLLLKIYSKILNGLL